MASLHGLRKASHRYLRQADLRGDCPSEDGDNLLLSVACDVHANTTDSAPLYCSIDTLQRYFTTYGRSRNIVAALGISPPAALSRYVQT